MPVCNYNWDVIDAWVVCRQLGFANVKDFTKYYGGVSGLYSMYNINCIGNESSLAECAHDKQSGCYGRAAGVACSSSDESLSSPKYGKS